MNGKAVTQTSTWMMKWLMYARVRLCCKGSKSLRSKLCPTIGTPSASIAGLIWRTSSHPNSTEVEIKIRYYMMIKSVKSFKKYFYFNFIDNVINMVKLNSKNLQTVRVCKCSTCIGRLELGNSVKIANFRNFIYYFKFDSRTISKPRTFANHKFHKLYIIQNWGECPLIISNKRERADHWVGARRDKLAIHWLMFASSCSGEMLAITSFSSHATMWSLINAFLVFSNSTW